MDVGGLEVLQPAALGLDTETAFGIGIDERRDAGHLSLTVLDGISGTHARRPTSMKAALVTGSLNLSLRDARRQASDEDR